MGVSTKPARGMRDFLPADVRRRRHVIGIVADVYQSYGFEPLETPAAENLETLSGKYGEEGDRLIFKILKRGEGAEFGQADLALRYDLTVPLARVVAEYRAQLPKFFKRYQVQPVWRADRPQKGRFREFYQCDVDAIGSTSMTVEAELLSAAADVFHRLGFTEFQIVVNHRKLLNAVLQHAGIPPPLHGTALVAMDKVDKIGVDGVKAEFAEKGLSGDIADRLSGLLGTLTVESLPGLAPSLDADGQVAAQELTTLFALCRQTSAGPYMALDGYLARGLSYYTGPIFEVRVADLAGSLGGGGRYDDLIGMFLGQKVPACGISLGLERILVVMGERGMFPPGVDRVAADVLVANFDADGTAEALALARELRAGAAGRALAVELYPDVDKLGKQFKYAADRGVPFVAVLGAAERAAGQVAIKHLGSGDQVAVPRGEAAAHIVRGMGMGRG